MRLYTVWDPPERWGDDAVLERTRFVREGFSWLALFLPVLWLLFHRMWVVLLLFLVASIGLEVAASLLLDVPTGIVGFAVSLVFAFEARGLLMWTLARKGWRYRGVVSGASREEAERRWFDGLLAASSEAPRPAPSGPTPAGPAPWGARPPAADDGMSGLVPGSGGAR